MASASMTAAVSTYGECVASLRTSLSFLESSVNTLGAGVADFPRLTSVLRTVRHYELVPSSRLAAAEASLRDELAPAISQLLDRAERQLERRDRRLETLKARAELQQGRLSMSTGGGDVTRKRATATAGKRKPAAARSPSRRTSTAARGALPHEGTPLDGEARLRAKAVRQRREALQYSVERMELEVLQKERELRKRLEKAAATAGAG